jgi:hypothetical protein
MRTDRLVHRQTLNALTGLCDKVAAGMRFVTNVFCSSTHSQVPGQLAAISAKVGANILSFTPGSPCVPEQKNNKAAPVVPAPAGRGPTAAFLPKGDPGGSVPGMGQLTARAPAGRDWRQRVGFQTGVAGQAGLEALHAARKRAAVCPPARAAAWRGCCAARLGHVRRVCGVCRIHWQRQRALPVVGTRRARSGAAANLYPVVNLTRSAI